MISAVDCSVTILRKSDPRPGREYNLRMEPNEKDQQQGKFALNAGTGVALGAGLGAALGVAFGNIAVGVGVGVALGVALGAAVGGAKAKK